MGEEKFVGRLHGIEVDVAGSQSVAQRDTSFGGEADQVEQVVSSEDISFLNNQVFLTFDLKVVDDKGSGECLVHLINPHFVVF